MDEGIDVEVVGVLVRLFLFFWNGIMGLPRIHYDNGNLCHCHYFWVVKIDLLFGFRRRRYSPVIA